MNENPTKELPGATPFEQRVLAELGSLRSEFRGELGSLRSEFSSELGSLRSEFKAELGSLRSEFKAELGSLRSEFKAELGGLRSEVAELRIQQTAMAKNIAALDQRLTSLEERVDSRLQETRPIWEAVQAQLKKLDEKFGLFILDLYDLRSDIGLHDNRLGVLERRVLS